MYRGGDAISKSPNIIVVSRGVGIKKGMGGGELRAFKSITEYTRYFNVFLLPPINMWDEFDVSCLRSDIRVLKPAVNPLIKKIYSNPKFNFIHILTPYTILRSLVKLNTPRYIDGVIVLHEHLDTLSLGRVLSRESNVPSMALLQLPPFYGDRRRYHEIMKALKIWYQELYPREYVKKFLGRFIARFRACNSSSKAMKELLNDYTLLVAVSRSIPLEMGDDWISKVYIMDPGVALDHEDLDIINQIKMNFRDKENYVMFGGRVDAGKGFIEALAAFKKILSNYSELKLVVTGYLSDYLKVRVLKYISRLGLTGKVLLTGYVARQKRLELVRRAKLMLYPSHVDAFPYSVLESVYLETPVVAYDIPALKLYYGKCNGVFLVREGDVEGLAAESMNALHPGSSSTSPPVLRSWDEILREEISLIFKLVRKS